MADKFLYFGFGSNLLTERIHLNNPSASKVSIAKLDDYYLTFGNFSKNWGGASATIKPKSGSHVWGVLWELDKCHLSTLDRQEGVPIIYQRIKVTVETPDKKMYEAVAYHLVKGLEKEPVPSALYHGVILRGATEHGMPEDYMKFLRAIKNNGFEGHKDAPLKYPSDPFKENFETVS